MQSAPKTQSYLFHMDITRKISKSIDALCQAGGFSTDLSGNGNKFNNKEVEDKFYKLCLEKNITVGFDDFIKGDITDALFGEHTKTIKSAYTEATYLAKKFEDEDELFQFDADSLVVPNLKNTLSLSESQSELFDDALIIVNNLSEGTLERGVGLGCDVVAKDIKISLSKNGEDVFTISGCLYESNVITTNSLFEEVLEEKFGYGEPEYLEGLSGLFYITEKKKDSAFGYGEEINGLLFEGTTSRRTPIFHPLKTSNSNSENDAISVSFKALAHAFENESKLSVKNIGGHSVCPIHRYPKESDFSKEYEKEMSLKLSKRNRTGLGGILLSANLPAFDSDDFTSKLRLEFIHNDIKTLLIETK